MSRVARTPRATITSRFVDEVCARVAANKPVRRTLPAWGRLHVDRAIPFLCVYRRPWRADDPGTPDLVTTEAAYLLASTRRSERGPLRDLLTALCRIMKAQFGAVLIIEVWASAEAPGVTEPTQPSFKIRYPRNERLGRFVDTLEASFSRISVGGFPSAVRTIRTSRCHPPGMSSLLTDEEGTHWVGLEVGPVYRDAATGDLYPTTLRALRRQMSRALRRSAYQFVRTHTTHRPPHFQALGRSGLRKVVLEADRRLSDVSNAFDFLLQVTPVNAEQAWRDYQASRYRYAPVLHYRPSPVEPRRLKRLLFQAPLERIEDPALEHLFVQKQDELDRQITMLGDIGTSRFVHGSVQLYGGVDEELHASAKRLLAALPKRTREARSTQLDAETFAVRVREEVSYYRKQWSEVRSTVEVRADVGAGVMVSRGSLLIGRETRIPAERVEALLQHEVGTHVVTYYNGSAQPLRQLCAGLAGYEALQEGIAVLSEYLVGGLSAPRLRLLAARVVAVRSMLDGAPFQDTFAELVDAHGFELRTAFNLTLRVFRSGGLTKDAVYLLGLTQLLDYIRVGGDLEALLVGKMAAEHVPIIVELRHSGVLKDLRLRPRYLDMPAARTRLHALRNGVDLMDLIRKT